ncbi:hypothetical protein BDN71DRAFT_798610 [Pleurotus eryngii]|uniref:Uncharacterized protein n=1 Tax=Pleurotus eryngii TaxID=5323 RepID=A0A9P5ZX03_PLEER|nr:hypothetical protein BDN71DRAFT_798321 [Pleurotus eryngii]KAF9496026.1 hypothetical protein BDN71DRAFT_798610 [Pleurotus eryngii]
MTVTGALPYLALRSPAVGASGFDGDRDSGLYPEEGPCDQGRGHRTQGSQICALFLQDPGQKPYWNCLSLEQEKFAVASCSIWKPWGREVTSKAHGYRAKDAPTP